MKRFFLALALAVVAAEKTRNVGGQKDEGGCYTGAGFQYCKNLKKCVRQWILTAEDPEGEYGGKYGGMTFEEVCEGEGGGGGMIGGTKDENGCLPAAGQVWCARREECHQPWTLEKDLGATWQDSCCSEVMCMMYCEHGFELGADKCPKCSCNDAPVCKQMVCENKCRGGYVKDKNGCNTCKCNCPMFKCAQNCDKYKYDEDGCRTCTCDDDDEALPFCNNLPLQKRYCNTLDDCEDKCQCNKYTEMMVQNEGTRSSAAWCKKTGGGGGGVTQMCKNSPRQMCRMMCPKKKCKEGQCLMREGTCCTLNCVDEDEDPDTDCDEGEAWDDFEQDCVAVTCQANPCEADQVCVKANIQCVRAPCEQYQCKEPTPFCEDSPDQMCKMMCARQLCEEEGQCLMRQGNCCEVKCVTPDDGEVPSYKDHQKACKRTNKDKDSCTDMGCKYKKKNGKCKAQKANKWSCKFVKDEDYCNDQAPDYCQWKKGKCAGGKGQYPTGN